MIILACLPPARLERLRAVAGGAHGIQTAADWHDAMRSIRESPVDVFVGDPSFNATEPDPAPLLALRARFRSLPFVVYSSLDASTASALAELGRAGFEEVVLEGVDDEAWRLLDVLEKQPGVALAARLLDRIQPALQQVPLEVARAVERVIHTPAAFRGVPDLAAAASVSRRTIYREFERAHLASPREIIAASRALRAYAFLRESDRAIDEVAAALRFSSAHHLTKTMRWACGMTTARVREHIGPEELIDRLVERIVPAPGSAPGTASADAPYDAN